ncbi:hypothetical protein Vretifemale_17433 [Volvox reticuliferus]|uniref:J domain-containing protein n=1 Tax=Volvox reticuliferus TaxID=1737510 RepID=A0A8J4CZK9_9CHLO|nr:hypothetical protein Vretifemale_17433 [Volvox reticuliferus]
MRLGMWSLPRVTRSAKPCRAAQRARKTYQTLMRTSATSIASDSATRRTHYQVLGVQPTASSDDIRTAFRRLAKSLHPDHNKLPGAREKFQEVKEAYDILFDTSTRADYDRELKVQAMAAAAAVAQSASGGRRASTTNVRRNRHTGSAKTQAATRPASGDDFDVFSSSASHGGGSGSRGSSNGNGSDGYRSIFCEPQRATSGGSNSNTYRSVFDGPSATAPAASSPLPLHMASAAQAAAARSRSGQTGASSSDSGYKSIFGSGTSPRSTSTGRNSSSSSSGGSNPCIFNGRSISPNLGTRKQTLNDVAAPPAAAPYGSRTAAGAATTTATSSSPASNGKSSRNGINAGNGTGANEASTTAAASAISGAAPNTASSSRTPYTVSPSIPGVGNPSHGMGAAAATPAANTVCTTAAGMTALQNGLASEGSRGAAASARNSIGDVASRLAAMAAAAAAGAPRSGSGGSSRGDYVSVFSGSGGGTTTQTNTSAVSAPDARSSSPGRMMNGGAVTDTTALSNVAAAGTASFQVTVTPNSGARLPAVESASQPPFASSLPLPPPLSPLPQQPLPRQPQQQLKASSTIAQLSGDDARRHPNAQVTADAADAVTSALVAEAEAAARVTAAMAAAAEAKAAAAAAEAMAAEAAVAAARAKAAAMAAEARLSAVVEAAESALLAKPWQDTTEPSASGPMSTTAADDHPQASEEAAPSKWL